MNHLLISSNNVSAKRVLFAVLFDPAPLLNRKSETLRSVFDQSRDAEQEMPSSSVRLGITSRDNHSTVRGSKLKLEFSTPVSSNGLCSLFTNQCLA